MADEEDGSDYTEESYYEEVPITAAEAAVAGSPSPAAPPARGGGHPLFGGAGAKNALVAAAANMEKKRAAGGGSADPRPSRTIASSPAPAGAPRNSGPPAGRPPNPFGGGGGSLQDAIKAAANKRNARVEAEGVKAPAPAPAERSHPAGVGGGPPGRKPMGMGSGSMADMIAAKANKRKERLGTQEAETLNAAAAKQASPASAPPFRQAATKPAAAPAPVAPFRQTKPNATSAPVAPFRQTKPAAPAPVPPKPSAPAPAPVPPKPIASAPAPPNPVSQPKVVAPSKPATPASHPQKPVSPPKSAAASSFQQKPLTPPDSTPVVNETPPKPTTPGPRSPLEPTGSHNQSGPTPTPTKVETPAGTMAVTSTTEKKSWLGKKVETTADPAPPVVPKKKWATIPKEEPEPHMMHKVQLRSTEPNASKSAPAVETAQPEFMKAQLKKTGLRDDEKPENSEPEGQGVEVPAEPKVIERVVERTVTPAIEAGPTTHVKRVTKHDPEYEVVEYKCSCVVM